MIKLDAFWSEALKSHTDLALPQEVQSSSYQFSNKDRIYQQAKVLSYELGFNELDAECLALAWFRFYQADVTKPTSWPDQLEFFAPKVINPPYPACPKNLGLYVVAPNSLWIERLCAAGVKTVQLRFKHDDQTVIANEVATACKIAERYPESSLFINDYWRLAIQHSAYGIHLGQEDLADADLLAIQKSGLRLGISTHGYHEMVIAHQIKPSYIALGAVFPTTLKVMPSKPQGTGRLKRYASLMREYPLVAIGGINHANLAEVLRAQIGSIAMVRGIIQADNPEAEIKKYMRQLADHGC